MLDYIGKIIRVCCHRANSLLVSPEGTQPAGHSRQCAFHPRGWAARLEPNQQKTKEVINAHKSVHKNAAQPVQHLSWQSSSCVAGGRSKRPTKRTACTCRVQSSGVKQKDHAALTRGQREWQRERERKEETGGGSGQLGCGWVGLQTEAIGLVHFYWRRQHPAREPPALRCSCWTVTGRPHAPSDCPVLLFCCTPCVLL